MEIPVNFMSSISLYNFKPVIAYFGDAKSLKLISLQISLLRVRYKSSPYNWRRLWGGICALASTVVGVKKSRATFSETIYYSNNHSEVNNNKNRNMRKIERVKTTLLLLFILKEKFITSLTSEAHGACSKANYKGRRLTKPAEE